MGRRSPAQRLTEEQQAFIVTSLACFRTPTQVSDALRERYGVDFPRQRVEHYDPTKRRAQRGKLAKKWVALFWETRKTWANSTRDEVAIANERYQLEQLQELYEHAPDRNVKLRLELLIEAAKMTGGIYTNRRQHELSGPAGAPIPTQLTVTFLPTRADGDG